MRLIKGKNFVSETGGSKEKKEILNSIQTNIRRDFFFFLGFVKMILGGRKSFVMQESGACSLNILGNDGDNEL